MCTKRPQALKTRVSFDKFWIKFEIKWQNINVGIPRRSFLPFSAFPAVRGNAEKVTSLIFLVCALNGMRIHQMRLVCLKGKRLASRMTPTRIAYVVYLACYGRQKKSLRRSPNFPYLIAERSKSFLNFEKNGKYVIVPTAFYLHTIFEIDNSFLAKL